MADKTKTQLSWHFTHVIRGKGTVVAFCERCGTDLTDPRIHKTCKPTKVL